MSQNFAKSGADSAPDRPPFDSIQYWIETHFPRHYCLVFFGSFALVLLVHLYLFTNLFINQDNVYGMFSASAASRISTGRWLLQPVTYLAGNFSSPWLDGVLGALLLAAACTLFCAIFGVCRPIPACLLTLCMVAFPTVASIYTYMHIASQYFFSMLLAVLAAWLIRRGGVGASFLGIVCIVCSMGIYQAFFCLAAATLVLTMLVEVCAGRWKDSFKAFFITGLRYLVCLALGMILYFAVTKLCLWYTGTELTDYQGISGMGQITLPILLRRVKEAYKQLIICYFRNPMYSRLFPALVTVSILLDAAAIVLLLLARRLHKSVVNLAELAVLTVIFPLACNSIYLMTESPTVHHVMVYPAVIPLLLPVMLGNQITVRDIAALRESGGDYLRSLSVFFVCGLLIVQAAFGYQFFVSTNRIYTLMNLNFESSYAYFTRLTAKIELQEGYTPDTHVAIIGESSLPLVLPDANLTGALDMNGIVNMYSREKYLQYFMSSFYQFASEEEVAAAEASPEFQQMPCYPSEGSISTINGVIVVKLSEGTTE